MCVASAVSKCEANVRMNGFEVLRNFISYVPIEGVAARIHFDLFEDVNIANRLKIDT